MIIESEMDELPRNLNFTWTLTGCSNRALQFKIEFENPIDISSGPNPDRLICHFTPDKSFQSMLFEGKNFRDAEYEVDRTLAKQMQDSAAAEGLSAASDGAGPSLQFLFWVGFGMQYLGSDALRIMSLMMRQMQLIMHIPAMQVLMPPNVMIMFTALLPIVQWDMLDGMITLDIFFSYTEEDAPFPGQLEELGYESSNFIMNTQTISMFLFFLQCYLICLVLLSLLTCVCKCIDGPYIHSAKKFLAKQLFFSGWIKLTLEANIEFLIASYLTFCNPMTNFYGDIFSLVYATMALTLSLVFLPILISLLWKKRWQALRSRKYAPFIGELYDQMRTRNRKAVSFLTTLSLRRFLFVLLIMLMTNNDMAGLQWVLILLCVIIMPSISTVGIRVNYSTFENRLEFFNEWVCGSAFILACLFTEIHDA
jgi:hypothetical protein